jgi:hypothetical protein
MHGKKVCQYGKSHGGCRCMDNTVISVVCDIPEHWQDAQPEQSGWLDPKTPVPHRCVKPISNLDTRDVGRRWRCQCGKVWRLDKVRYDQKDRMYLGEWSEQQPIVE